MTETPFNVASLLDSLHIHLQEQTKLLPALHAQLGLPQSALTDELTSLQHQLVDCVEKQIENRRNEVDEWMKKCGEIENECLRFAKALGTHVKTLGASVGELRKEQILPRRFDMLMQYREKLDYLYRTKLEQLNNLITRLNSLARTLGLAFYPRDVTEHTPAPGEDQAGSSAKVDLTSDRFSRLEKEVMRGKTEISRRLTQVSGTMMEVYCLYEELGMDPPSSDDTICLSSSLSGSSRGSHSSSSTAVDPFSCSTSSLATPTPASRSSKSSVFNLTDAEDAFDYERIFAQFASRVNEAEDEGHEIQPELLIGLDNVEPTLGLIHWVESTKASLEEVKKRREMDIQAMYDQLETLWQRLGVEVADMDEFVERNRGTTEANVETYKSELSRMLELKQERMAEFIENARVEIESLWNDLMYGKEERADFAPFTDDEYTEDLLTTHEDEIKRLKEERRSKAPLLASIRKYFQICEEEKELAAAASDQTRLMGRGPRDPGRLLREEKMRKRVTKEKPRIEQELLQSIPTWESEMQRPFLVNGTSIVDILLEATAVAADKENARNKPRAGSVPPRATTPVASTGARNGASAISAGSGYKPGSATGPQSVPNKRLRSGTPSSNHVALSNNTLASSYSETHRVPFGQRAQLLNSSGSMVSDLHSVPSKTPNSCLPRPISMSKSQSSISKYGPGNGIGLGYASTMKVQQKRIVSETSLASSTSSSNVFNKPNRTKRPSFKPRPSIDRERPWIGADGRWAGFNEAAVKEEDEF